MFSNRLKLKLWYLKFEASKLLKLGGFFAVWIRATSSSVTEVAKLVIFVNENTCIKPTFNDGKK